jgi:thiopurine S-methyltransferase
LWNLCDRTYKTKLEQIKNLDKERNMEKNFWLDKWKNKATGFHNQEINPFLVKYIQNNFFNLTATSKVFVPLCGKTIDIGYLLKQGFRITGCELSEIAVKALFADLNINPIITRHHDFTIYSTIDNKIKVFVGDIFDLKVSDIGNIDLTYDRAALVALPPALQLKYANHLISITKNAPQLLISLSFDPKIINSPPFSISNENIIKYFSKHYSLEILEQDFQLKGLKGKYEVTEICWSLTSL